MLLQTNQTDIPKDCQFLLEIEATPRYDTTPMEKISYWILAMNGALAEMAHERRREQYERRRGRIYKKKHWNIVNGVREAYSARGAHKGNRRMDGTSNSPANKRRRTETTES
jgi:hypothetical protein